MPNPPSLPDLVRAEITVPVDPKVTEMAAAIAGRYGDSALAVLFYGSCLRQTELDGLMLDFYLIVSDYREAYGRGWFALANRLVPPNVFAFSHNGLMAKYAVLSVADFHRECGPEATTVSVWARFAQPSRLVWTANSAVESMVAEIIARAAPTLLCHALPMADAISGPASDDPLAIWRKGFELTYECELRAERNNRAGMIVDSDAERYARFAAAALPLVAPRGAAQARRAWRRLRRHGKWLSVVRLAKASTTFAGGIDYLAWKINRHAGTDLRLKAWHRRWPLIAAITLVPRLLRRGAIH